MKKTKSPVIIIRFFERYHKFNIKNGYSKKAKYYFKELTTLSVGDYVTY
jgi:transcription-repair coupling factor (superfamily II helicase)